MRKPSLGCTLFICFLTTILVVACKPRRAPINGADLATLNASDIQAIMDGKNALDSHRHKIFIFFESENQLTNGGESFVTEYIDLLKNNLGSNYSIYIVSSVEDSKGWFGAFETSAKNYSANKNDKNVVRYARRGGTDVDLSDLVSKVVADYGRDQKENQNDESSVQIILHFLAHGLAVRGNGEGVIGLQGSTLSWSDLASKVIEPLADVSDELMVILESCYGGSLISHLPQGFFIRKNAMIVFGAPSWAPQNAPVSDDPSGSMLIPAEIRKKYTTSIATIAVKAGLMGFASNRQLNDSSSSINPEDSVKFNHQEVVLFDGQTTLKEKHVVRVNEFVNYVEKKGELMNCKIVRARHHDAVSSLCKSPKGIDMIELGFGVDDNPLRNLIDLTSISKMSKEEYLNFVKTRFTVPPVTVKYPSNPNASLNPNAAIDRGNGILSLVNLQVFDDARIDTDKSYQNFVSLDRDGLPGVLNQYQECLNELTEIDSDLWEMTQSLKSLGELNDSPAKKTSEFPQNQLPAPISQSRQPEKDDAKYGPVYAPVPTTTPSPNPKQPWENSKPKFCATYGG